MRIEVRDSLEEVDCAAWNALNRDNSPFLRHEFFRALECNGCLGDAHGWFPRYFLQYTDDDQLIAAAPGFIKTNSYGEFVFDWSWAEAYHKHGIRYYPKMVVSVPYTPVTGQRLLIAESYDYEETARTLHATILNFCQEQKLSGLHWLFTLDEETDLLESDGLMRRTGCQYHWRNNDYTGFDDYLAEMRAKKRKQVKRERRRAIEFGISFELKHGNELNEYEIGKAHGYYVSTFDKKWGEASLTRGFFEQVAHTMGEQLVVVFAKKDDQIIACSIMFRSDDALFGRYWGCEAEYNALHFETCFYQGIEYCIANNIQRFEPGAQGEHKIWRGFLPTKTWSAHWIADDQFRDAIVRYLNQETDMMEEQSQYLQRLSPFHREHLE
ncbi:MAG: GNAT family N-acetyltransferase [Pseudomonadota bacterium]